MTLETIIRTVLHAVAWSALVAFCGVVAGVGVRWMLRMLGDALSETSRRYGKFVAMVLASVALVCGVAGGNEKQIATVPQTFSMNSQGCLRVSKYQYWSERSLNGRLNKSEGMRE